MEEPKPKLTEIRPGVYQVYVPRIDGRKRVRLFSRRTCRGRDPLDAANDYLGKMSRLLSGYRSCDESIKISEYMPEYIIWAKTEKSRRTVDKDRGRLKIFLAWAEKNKIIYLNDIDHKTMDRFRVWYKRNRGRNPNNYISIVYALLQRAVKTGVIKKNPLSGYKKEKIVTDESVKFFSKAEVGKILAAMAQPFPYNFFLILLHTGLRIDELIGLKLSDIDIENRMITIESRIDHPTKSRRTRYVPMTDKAYGEIKSLVIGSTDPDSVYLFDNGRGDNLYKYNWYLRYFKRLCDDIGIPNQKRKPHVFRHTFVTRLLSLGVKLYIISGIVGHSDFRTTIKTYGHMDPEYREQIKKLDF